MTLASSSRVPLSCGWKMQLIVEIMHFDRYYCEVLSLFRYKRTILQSAKPWRRCSEACRWLGTADFNKDGCCRPAAVTLMSSAGSSVAFGGELQSSLFPDHY